MRNLDLPSSTSSSESLCFFARARSFSSVLRSTAILLVHLLDVLRIAGVDLEDVTLLDVKRNADDEPRLHGCRLLSARRRVALEARLRGGHRQLGENGQLDPEGLAVVE